MASRAGLHHLESFIRYNLRSGGLAKRPKPIKLTSNRKQFINMPILSLQLRSQHLAAPKANRSTLNVDDQPRTFECRQRRPLLQSTIGHHQQPLLLRRKAFLPRSQPMPRLAQCRQQRRTTTRPKPIEPVAQTAGGFQALHLPLRRHAASGQQRQARALAVSVVEQLRQ